MKRLFNILILMIIVLGAMAQERTVSLITLDKSAGGRYYSYYNYSGTSSDQLIYTTRDTIDIPFNIRKSKRCDISVGVTFSPILGADTTATIAILGRNSLNDSWNSITSGLSAAVTTDDVYKEVTTFSTYDEKATIDTTLLSTALASTKDSVSFYVTNVSFSAVGYRYINVRLIITGDDSVGTGIQVDNVEFKIWER